MPATLDLYVNTSSPSKQKAFVTSLRSLSAPAVAEYIVRTPTLRVRIHPMTVAAGFTVGTTLDWGDTPVIKFGGKLTSTFKTSDTVLFYSEDFVKDDTDEADIFYWADVTLNTDEFIAAFSGTATSISVITEIELDGDTVAQGLATGLWDVLRGGEGLPVPAVPDYPSAPTDDTVLSGKAGDWYKMPFAELATNLAPFYQLTNMTVWATGQRLLYWGGDTPETTVDLGIVIVLNISSAELTLSAYGGAANTLAVPSGWGVRFSMSDNAGNGEFTVSDLWPLAGSSQGKSEHVLDSGNLTLSLPAGRRHHTALVTVGGTTRTSIVVIPVSDRSDGDTLDVVLDNPSLSAITLELRNATTGGTLLKSVFSDDGDARVSFVYDSAPGVWVPTLAIQPSL